jgi:hypothetical protein
MNKKLVNLNFAVLSLQLFCFSGCVNQVNKTANKNYVKFSSMGKFIVKETYDSIGLIRAKQYFNKDTIPDGSEIEYYSNNRIEKWKWHTLDNKYPICGVYYSSKGFFDSFKGRPFIEFINKDKMKGSLYIELINPPNINSIVLLDDSSCDHRLQLKYDPIVSGSLNWVIIGDSNEDKLKNGHRYTLYYFVVDSNKKELYRATKAMYLYDSGRYEFIDIPPKILTLGSL